MPRRDPGAVRPRPRGLRRRHGPFALRTPRHLAGWPTDSRPCPRTPRRRPASSADADEERSGVARVAGDALGRGGRVVARKTSFYYSFLVLPDDQRRAIIAVWDFCRAVDDAVDESEASRDG